MRRRKKKGRKKCQAYKYSQIDIDKKLLEKIKYRVDMSVYILLFFE